MVSIQSIQSQMPDMVLTTITSSVSSMEWHPKGKLNYLKVQAEESAAAETETATAETQEITEEQTAATEETATQAQ